MGIKMSDAVKTERTVSPMDTKILVAFRTQTSFLFLLNQAERLPGIWMVSGDR
jgi:hypothetical protein